MPANNRWDLIQGLMG